MHHAPGCAGPSEWSSGSGVGLAEVRHPCDASVMAVDARAAARLVRERAQQARAERERRAAEARRQVQVLVPPLLPEGGRAWLIGSLAWGGFGERSDIDLVTCGVSGPDATRIEDAVARSVGIGVELLELEALPSGFRQRVEREGIPLHGR